MLAQGLSSEKIDFCQHLISRLEGERRASVDAPEHFSLVRSECIGRETLSHHTRQRSFLTSWTHVSPFDCRGTRPAADYVSKKNVVQIIGKNFHGTREQNFIFQEKMEPPSID
ncbi:hypothetical protein TNCT_352761 [Trichonephila clavata]|uniref:Uncharacterized protein n=1 Tax=Trichonephila clavata TaxID=2740835 RepID=A0A8X6GYI3_TRICU|nr:hypothetical protein TNCT_488501 [Trichonephila clavata]GFR21132.1 hypothetical protein TNCT_352761 [Trichonephila clavata]